MDKFKRVLNAIKKVEQGKSFGLDLNSILKGDPMDRVKEALELASKMQWRPIETSPKTIRSVILGQKDHSTSIYILMKHKSHGFYWDKGGAFYCVHGQKSWEKITKDQPTHWMPLPEAKGGDDA